MQILSTKLHIPASRSVLISRPALIERLNKGAKAPLILVCAPAGFGKSTAISSWLNESKVSAAWLSLDTIDSSPARFLLHFIAALQTIEAEIGGSVVALLDAGHIPLLESVFTQIINEAAVIHEDFFLILDDFHLVQSQEISQGLRFLLQNIPGHMHIIVISREEPDLPLASLRASGELCEIRQDDLRLNDSETLNFLTRRSDAAFSPAEAVELRRSTEGWITAIQLATLSMDSPNTTREALMNFNGNHRFITDYLIDEVLSHLDAALTKFILDISILDRFTADLCKVVSHREDANQLLEQLEQKNLFLIALDDERQWFRFHHLFAQALTKLRKNANLNDETAKWLAASRWFALKGYHEEAIDHALRGGAYHQAADVIERAWSQMDSNYQSGAWIAQVQQLPEEIVLLHPVLCAGYGWTMLYQGRMEESERWFCFAEAWLKNPQATEEGMRVADTRQYSMLAASIHSARAYRSLAINDYQQTLHHARLATNASGDNYHQSRTQALALGGIAQFAMGNLQVADREMSALIDHMHRVNRIGDAVELVFLAADIRMTCGRLEDAMQLYRRAFSVLNSLENPNIVGREELHRGSVDIYREMGDWNSAEDQLMAASEYGSLSANRPDWMHRLHLSAARLELSRNNLEAALDHANIAMANFEISPIPQLRSAATLIARIKLVQGDRTAIKGPTGHRLWLEKSGFDADGDITLTNEFDFGYQIRYLLWDWRHNPAGRQLETALELLDRMETSAREGGRLGSLMEVHIMQALTLYNQECNEAAMDRLLQALALSGNQGYRRVYLDEGDAILHLLKMLEKQNRLPAHARSLLPALSIEVAQQLVEPLSDREQEVLEMLAGERSGPEIAGQLYISLSTMRTHTRNIFGKLGVNSRRSAVRRARELSLIL